MTNFAVFTLFVSVNGSLIRLRMTRPEAVRPFRVGPSFDPVPLPTLVGLLGAIGLAGFMEREAFLVGLGALALGGALSFVFVRNTSKTIASR